MKNIYNAQVLSGPLGTLSAAAPFFNSVLKKLPHFVEKANTFDNTKDTTLTIIGQSTTIAKDLLTLESSLWTPGKQDTFSNYMGQTISGWANVSSLALGEMFNGTDPAIDLLWSTISNGKLIKEAKFDEEPPKSGNAENELRANVAKSFFGYSIPALWQASRSYLSLTRAMGVMKISRSATTSTTTQWTPRVSASATNGTTTWLTRTVTPWNANATTTVEAPACEYA